MNCARLLHTKNLKIGGNINSNSTWLSVHKHNRGHFYFSTGKIKNKFKKMDNWGKNVSTGYRVWLNCHSKKRNMSVILQSVHHRQMLIQAFLYNQPNPHAPLCTPRKKTNQTNKKQKIQPKWLNTPRLMIFTRLTLTKGHGWKHKGQEGHKKCLAAEDKSHH